LAGQGVPSRPGSAKSAAGIGGIGFQASSRGNKPWEEQHPEIAKFLGTMAETHSQQAPTFHSSIAFTRLTARSALDALKEEGFTADDLPSLSSMAEILNRCGYRLRKVVKAKPLKKIAETEAICENIKKKTRKPKTRMSGVLG
jgi:hypothetical protein